MKHIRIYMVLFAICGAFGLFAQKETNRNELYSQILINYKEGRLYHGVKNRIEFISPTESEDRINIFSRTARIEIDSVGFLVIPLEMDSVRIGASFESDMDEIADTIYLNYPVYNRWSSSAFLQFDNSNFEREEAKTYKMSKTDLVQLKGILPILDSKLQMRNPQEIQSFTVRLVKAGVSIDGKTAMFGEDLRQLLYEAKESEIIIIDEIMVKTDYLPYYTDKLKIKVEFDKGGYTEYLNDIIIFVQ